MGVVCFVLQLLWCLRWAHPLPGRGNAHSWACSQAQCSWPCESLCGPASPRPAAARPTLPVAPARGADPPACSSPSVPLAPPAPLPCPMPVPGMLPAADSKSVTWTRGSFVAQAVSFFSLTVPAVLRGLQPLQGLPRWPAPPPRSEPQGTSGQARRSCRVQSVLGRTKVPGGEAGSRLLPPRPRAAFCLHATSYLLLPLPRLGRGHPLTLGPAPGSFLSHSLPVWSLHCIPIAGPVALMSGWKGVFSSLEEPSMNSWWGKGIKQFVNFSLDSSMASRVTWFCWRVPVYQLKWLSIL